MCHVSCISLCKVKAFLAFRHTLFLPAFRLIITEVWSDWVVDKSLVLSPHSKNFAGLDKFCADFAHSPHLCVGFPSHSLKTSMFRSVGDSKSNRDVSVRVNDMCVLCPMCTGDRHQKTPMTSVGMLMVG